MESTAASRLTRHTVDPLSAIIGFVGPGERAGFGTRFSVTTSTCVGFSSINRIELDGQEISIPTPDPSTYNSPESAADR